MKEKKHIRKFILIGMLLILSIIAHFLPFERAALAPDDYAALARIKDAAFNDIPSTILRYYDRPLSYLVIFFQAKFATDDNIKGFFILLFSVFFLIISIFYILREIFKDECVAFLGAFIFFILPQISEIYHTPIFANINMVTSIYIWSIIFYIRYVKKEKKRFLFASMFFYIIGIFWYEIGFFLPLFLAMYCFLYEKKKIKEIVYFILPALFYAIYRFTGAFGLGVKEAVSHSLEILFFPLTQVNDLFHQYAGRYAVRNTFYGLYNFFAIEKGWFFILIGFDIALFFTLLFSIKNKKIPFIDGRLFIVAVCFIFIFLVPLFISKGSGIAGRHLVLPSLGLVIFIIAVMSKLKPRLNIFLILFILFLVFISQGVAWTQVVSCRINGAVYETMKEYKEEMKLSDNILIDARSFADNIPFTWIDRDFNVLNTYYGAQAFEDWGLKSMANIVLEGSQVPVYVTSSRPELMDGGRVLRFQISEQIGYRAVEKKHIKLPAKNTFIIDFNSVYKSGFKNGKRN